MLDQELFFHRVSAGEQHVCAIEHMDQRVECWGSLDAMPVAGKFFTHVSSSKILNPF